MTFCTLLNDKRHYNALRYSLILLLMSISVLSPQHSVLNPIFSGENHEHITGRGRDFP